MIAFVIRRVLYLIPVLFVLTAVVFGFVELLPGDVIDMTMGDGGVDNPAVRTPLEKQLGLDQPIYMRYGAWLLQIAQGDLGKSLVTRRDVSLELFDRIPATVYLALTGMAISLMIAVPLGTLAAVRRNSWVDGSVQVFTLIGISIPEFWFAIMAILLFALHLGWLPSSGYTSPLDNIGESVMYLLLPAFAIGFRLAAYTTRLTRSSMLDELQKDYVDTARALGFSEARVVCKYTLRNAMIPTLTISGVQLAELLGGTLVIEVIFAWPGIGRVIYEAIQQRDYPMIQSGVLVLGFFVVIVNLLVDIAYRAINPRVEYS